jgi:hypothetical protein
LLEPLDFDAAIRFFRSYRIDDLIRTYAILGGMPAYLLQLDERKTVLANIRDPILTPHHFLNDEPRSLLREELRNPANYFSILAAIAAGKTRQHEIAQAAALPSHDTAGPYLRTMQALHLVERQVPAAEPHPHKSRKGIYRMSDHFMRFWFRFVYPHESALARGDLAGVLERRITPYLDEFVSLAFEELAHWQIWRLARAGRLPFAPDRVGAWWDGQHEIHVVAVGEGGLLLGECKWSTRAIGVGILDQLKRSGASLLAGEGYLKTAHPITYTLFSRSGFTPELRELAARENVILVEASDLATPIGPDNSPIAVTIGRVGSSAAVLFDPTRKYGIRVDSPKPAQHNLHRADAQLLALIQPFEITAGGLAGG